MKNKKDLIYYALLLIIIGGMIAWEIYKPKPVDWSVYYEQEKKEPYGTYALYKALPDLFSADSKIKTEDRTLYEQSYYESPFETNFIFITNKFTLPEQELRLLLNYVDDGNTVFIAADDFDELLSAELGFKIQSDFSFGKDSIELNFTNKHLKEKQNYIFRKTYGDRYFEQSKEENFTILALRNNNRPVFIRKKWGEGYFYLHLHPEVFTNYALVTQSNDTYAYKALSYLPSEYDVIWDEYYKPHQSKENSHLKYVMKNPGLKNAYRLSLLLLIIYSLFTAKRRQRIIPVIKPFKNTTLEFAETVGRLYYHSKNHKDIALKIYNYWQEHLRQFYYLSNDDIQLKYHEKIAEKTGASKNNIKKILSMIQQIENAQKINNDTLGKFNNLIEDFYNEAK